MTREREQHYARLLELRLRKDALGLIELAEKQSTPTLVRASALHKLQGIRDETVIGRLAGLLEDDDQGVRLAALRAIGASDGHAASEILTASLEHADPTAVAWAIDILGRRGQLATTRLVPFLASSDAMVRYTAVKALRRGGDRTATQPLRELARRERGAARAAALVAALMVARRRGG